MFIVVYNTTGAPLAVGTRVVSPRDFEAVDDALAVSLLAQGKLVAPTFNPTTPSTDPDAVAAWNEAQRLNGAPYTPIPLPLSLEERVVRLEQAPAGVGITDGAVTTAKLAGLAVTSAKLAAGAVDAAAVAATLKDGVATAATMRTLGVTALAAAAGNDARLSDARTPITHGHLTGELTDSTAVGRAVLTAATQAAAQTAIGVTGGGGAGTFGTTVGTYAEGSDARFLTTVERDKIAAAATAGQVTSLQTTASAAATSAGSAQTAAAASASSAATTLSTVQALRPAAFVYYNEQTGWAVRPVTVDPVHWWSVASATAPDPCGVGGPGDKAKDIWWEQVVAV